MDYINVELAKIKLKQDPFIEKKKLYPILKDLDEDEIDEVFSDSEILDRVIKSHDNSILSMVFRYSGSKTQDKIWENAACQKKLFGMGNVSDDDLLNTIKINKFYYSTEPEKKKKQGKFYFSKEKMRIFELFMRTIKSKNILDSLVNNKYFQIIILFSKKVPTSVINKVNVPQLFRNTVSSDLYKYASSRQKSRYCYFLNGFDSSLLLPDDFLQIFTETNANTYYDQDKKSLGNLLRSKLYYLKRENKKFDLSCPALRKLSIRELMVLEEADDSVVDKGELKNILVEIIGNAINAGSILSTRFIDFELLNNKSYFPIFQTIVRVLTSGSQCDKFLSYIFKHMFQEEYTKEEKKQILPLLKNCLLNVDRETAANLFFRPTDLKSMFFVKFGLSSRYMDYLNGISPKQILNMNVKHINKISKYLQDDSQDEISDIYSKAIKLYFSFGLDRTIAILEGQYGKVSKQFLDNVSKLIVKDVPMKSVGKKSEPILNDNFITFLFVSGQISHLFDNECNMSKNWYYLYNNIDELKELCHGHLTFEKVEIILKEKLNTVNYPLPPNCHRLESVLQEIGVGNKTSHKTNDVYDETVKIYDKQLKRIDSTIPYVNGKSNYGYRFETMKLHDVIAYVLGYRASCCIRVLDIAHAHLLHALLCESGRILIIYDNNDNPVAFSPLKRNGELLIANSIECIARSSYDEIKDAFMSGINAIVGKTKGSDEEIKVATIGRGSFIKPDSTQWPDNIPTPTILEKNDKVYRNTDEYHSRLNVIYQDENCRLDSLNYGKSKIKYNDPRESVCACDFKDDNDYVNQQKALNVINGVNYELSGDLEKASFKRENSKGIEFVIFSEDWYVLVLWNHEIQSKCLKYDARAESEMNTALNLVREAMTSKNVKQLVLSFRNKKI